MSLPIFSAPYDVPCPTCAALPWRWCRTLLTDSVMTATVHPSRSEASADASSAYAAKVEENRVALNQYAATTDAPTTLLRGDAPVRWSSKPRRQKVMITYVSRESITEEIILPLGWHVVAHNRKPRRGEQFMYIETGGAYDRVTGAPVIYDGIAPDDKAERYADRFIIVAQDQE